VLNRNVLPKETQPIRTSMVPWRIPFYYIKTLKRQFLSIRPETVVFATIAPKGQSVSQLFKVILGSFAVPHRSCVPDTSLHAGRTRFEAELRTVEAALCTA
jgi:hypothetical protein